MTRILMVVVLLLAVVLLARPAVPSLALPASLSGDIVRIEVIYADGSVQVFVPASSPTPSPPPDATRTPTPPPSATPRPSVTPRPLPTETPLYGTTVPTYTPTPVSPVPTDTPTSPFDPASPTPEATIAPPTPGPTQPPPPETFCWGGAMYNVRVRVEPSVSAALARDQEGNPLWWLSNERYIITALLIVHPEGTPNREEWAQRPDGTWAALWYAGTELIRLDNTAPCWELTPPETAVLFHAVPGANRWEMEAAWSILSAAGVPFGVKSVNDPDLCESAVSRGGTCIYRSLAPADCPNVDNPDPAYEARLYMQALAPHLMQAPHATMFEITNECNYDVSRLPWWNAFYLEALRLAAEWGWPPLVLPTYNPGAPAQEWHLDLLKPALVALRDAGGAYGAHAYSIYDDVGLCESDEWLGYRHRRVRAKLDSMGLEDLPIAITEAARGGGGLPPDAADFACWVQNASEPGVHSLGLWSAGVTSSWPLANLNGHMLALARAVVAARG